MTKEQARVFVKAEKMKRLEQEALENARKYGN